MKLVVFGLTMSSSWGNGHASLWRALERGLARRKHRLVFFEQDVPYYAANRDLPELVGRSRLVLYRDWRDARVIAQKELVDADAAIVTSYCPDGVHATDLVLGSDVRVRAFYDMDAALTLAQCAVGKRIAYLGPSLLRGFELVLSFTGGPALRALRDRLGASRVEPLYGSVDPERHRPSDDPAEVADLSYLGSYSDDRQRVLAELFLEPARHAPERRFLIGGAKYPSTFPWRDNIHYRPHVAPVDHPRFYCSAPLTLNVTRAPMAQLGWCPSGRVFEAAACGVPVLSDRWPGIDDFFEPGREILLARTAEESLEALRLSKRDLRKIGRRARARVLDQHTGDRRAAELVALLDSATRRPPMKLYPVGV